MQRFQDLKNHLGTNLGYTSIKIAVGCGAVLAVSLLTTQYYMKWRKKRKITRIIDTFEEFQNGRVYIRNPDQVEDKVCQFIKGGSSKLQILTDFDTFLLLPEVHSELVNKNNGLSMDSVQTEIDYDCRIPEERYFPPKSDYPEEIVKSGCHSTIENGKVLHHSNEISRPLESILRKGCNAYLETILIHKVPLSLFTDYEEFVRKFVPCTTAYPNIYSVSSRSLKKKYLSEDDPSKRPNIILLGNMSKPDWMNDDSTTVLHIGFLEEEVDFGLLDYFAKYDIVITSEPYLDVVNAFLQRII